MMCLDTQGPLIDICSKEVKLTTWTAFWHHWSCTQKNWPWNVPASQRPLNWLVGILTDGNEGCLGANDSTINADFQHIFFIISWGIPEAHVLGVEKGLGSKAMNGEAERETLPWFREAHSCASYSGPSEVSIDRERKKADRERKKADKGRNKTWMG